MLPETKKKNKIDISENKPKVNYYYLEVSRKFKTAKYIVLCLLVCFLLVTVLLFRSEITLENFRYLIKDFELGDNLSVATDDVIVYDNDRQINAELFKGDLAIVGSSYFYLSDLQGNKILNESSLFSNPVMLTSNKYILIYGLSEYTYAVYNTFSQLHTETFDYPITDAALSDSGMYAIVTRTTEYRSAIYIYNKDFQRIGAVYKDKYLMDIQFNSTSDELILVSAYSQDGNYSTEVMTITPYSDAAKNTENIRDAIPLRCGYNSEGGYSIVFDNKINFYNSESKLITSYSSGTKSPLTADITEDYTVVTYNENIVGNDIKVLTFNSNGELINTSEVNGNPKKAVSVENYIYLLLENKLCRINLDDSSISYTDTDKNPLGMLVINKDTVFISYSDHTKKIKIQ